MDLWCDVLCLHVGGGQQGAAEAGQHQVRGGDGETLVEDLEIGQIVQR